MASGKKSLKWSDSIMSNFLDLYEKHDCLWNTNSCLYKNKDAREMAIQEIITELGLDLTDADIKNKIKSIRTVYKKELTFIFKSKNRGVGTVYEPKLTWFKQADSFLRAVTVARQNTSNLNIRDLLKEEKNEVSCDDVSTGKMITPKLEITQKTEVCRPSSTQESRILQAPILKRKLHSINEAIGKTEKIAKTFMTQGPDEFDYFGKLIASQLRNMTEYDAILCQKEIHSIIRNRRMLRVIEGPSNRISTRSNSTVSITPSSPSSPICEIQLSES